MITLSYQGLEADNHRIDAQTGGESLAGLGHALTLVGHYASTGHVRQRAPYSENIQFYIRGSRDGSLEWLIEAAVADPSTVAIGLGANGLSALVAYVFTRAIGREPKGKTKAIEDDPVVRTGDVDALIEAVEPALKRAHRVIGKSVIQIVVRDSVEASLSTQLDVQSKDYLETDVDAGISEQDVSIGALNVNSRYGRAYFADQGRTVPFRVDRDAHPRTVTELSRALNNYAKKNGRTVSVRFRSIRAPDDRLKRLVIYDAKHLEGDEL